MLRRIFTVVVLVGLLGVAAVFPVQAEAAGVVDVVELQDSINPGVQSFIEQSVEQAEEDSAELLVILLDTPGGLVTSMRGIVRAIMNSKVPVVVYVSPRGAQAASAGVFITASADIAAMAPGTNIGAASPVTSGGGEAPDTMKKKITNDLVAFARGIANQRGRNAEWLEDAVRDAVSVTAEKAFELNVIDLIADDLDDLLKRLDGWELDRGGEVVTLHTAGAEVRRLQPDWQHSILRAIANPNIAYILMLIGVAGLYFELSQPGAVLPGVVGAISLLLALYAMQALPVNFAGVLFFLLSMVFFILEIYVVSYGMLSIAGIVCLILGTVMTFGVPGAGPGSVSLWVFVPSVLVIGGFCAVIGTLAFRSQRAKPKTGSQALVGAVGETMGELAPKGQIFVAGEIWNAEADEDDRIPPGERVRVVSVENLKLKVTRISGT